MSTSTSFRLKVLTALSLTTVLLIQVVIYTSCQQDACIKDAKEASAIIQTQQHEWKRISSRTYIYLYMTAMEI